MQIFSISKKLNTYQTVSVAHCQCFFEMLCIAVPPKIQFKLCLKLKSWLGEVSINNFKSK